MNDEGRDRSVVAALGPLAGVLVGALALTYVIYSVLDALALDIGAPQTIYAVYVGAAVLAAGSFLVSRRWLALVIAAAFVFWTPVALRSIDTATTIDHMAVLILGAVAAALLQRARLSGLRQLEAAREQSARESARRIQGEAVQEVMLSISRAAWTANTLAELMGTARVELGKLIDTTNFFLALYDSKADSYSFPYHVDEYDDVASYSTAKLPKSHTDYVRRSGKPWLVDHASHQELVARGEVETVGTNSASWMGVPLTSGEGVTGVIVVQSYSERDAYSANDLEMLSYVSENIALAIERQQAQEAHRASESRYRSVVEDQSELVIRWLPDGTRTFVNESYCRFLQRPRAELIGSKLEPWTPGKDFEAILAGIRSMTPDSPIHRAEYCLTLEDGTTAWQHWTDRAIFDDRGTMIEVQSVGRDITDRRLAEDALRENERRLFQFLEKIPAGVVVTDARTGKEYFANQRAADLSGDRRIWLGREERETDAPAYLAGTDQRYPWASIPSARALAGEEAMADDIEIRLAGRTVPVHATASPIFDASGRVAYAISVFFDLTEINETQQQLRRAQKMELVGQLAGGVAHDFNNLLTGITGFTQLALGTDAGSTSISSDLEQVLECAHRAADVTRQLLAFSRHQALESRVFDVNTLVEATSKMLHRWIGEDIATEYMTAPDLPNVRADQGELEQVLLNLVINARDAMPDGGQITIETAPMTLDREYCRHHPGVEPGEYVMIAVTDTGCGMDEKVREHIFEPFFTTKEVGQGTGLGLATSYGIIKQHGGNIDVYSELGRGTTCKVYLPQVEASADAPGVVEAPGAATGSEVILLVEDEDLVREVVRRGLEDQGYRVLLAAQAEEAEQLFDQHASEIDLLVTDVVMPGIDGTALYERLCERGSDVRVLYMSGYPANGITRMRVLDPEANFLQKPFTSSQLARAVRLAMAS